MTDTPQQRFSEFFEEIISNFQKKPALEKEIVSARELFFGITGKLKDQDTDFTNRMNCFLLWFVFDWRSPTINVTPFEYYIEKLERQDNEPLVDSVKAYQRHIHSLFNFIKSKGDYILLQDVFSGKKISVYDANKSLGHVKGSLFETRLLPDGEEYFFADYFIHHPITVKKGILQRIKQIRKQKRSIKPFLQQLHSFHTKWTSYRNINIHSIYYFNASLPEAK